MTALEHGTPIIPRRIPMLAGGPDLAGHLAVHGPLPATTAAEVLAAARQAHLTGRGGAGFPVAAKLTAVATAGGHPVVVGNGSEGEPASIKDATLLRLAPHLVLDGAQAAAIAVGAREIVLYVRPAAVTVLEAALAERAQAGRRAGAAPAVVRIVQAAAGFVAGQETAVVAALSGRPALPSGSAGRVSTRGVDGRPTLVQNVETLAQLGLLTRLGHGRQNLVAGTALTTVWGPDGRAQVLEVSPGTTLRDLLGRAGWAGRPPSAVLLGGYHGRWLPARHLDVRLDPAELARLDARMGAGVVIPLTQGACGLAMSASITGYLAAESAKQCGPCTFGLPHLADLMEQLARQAYPPGLVPALERVAGLVEGRGACRHPDGTAGLVRSTLLAFADDVRAHAAGRCLATGTVRAA